MHRNLLVVSFLTIFLAFLVAPTFVFAEETFLPDPGRLPGSTFYFLKSWKEQVQLLFTFNEENKTELHLRLAELRLAEHEKLVDKGEIDVAQKTLERYEKHTARAIGKLYDLSFRGRDVETLTQEVEEATSRHVEILQRNLEQVPEAAKEGIERALEVSKRGLETATQISEQLPLFTEEEKEELEETLERMLTPPADIDLPSVEVGEREEEEAITEPAEPVTIQAQEPQGPLVILYPTSDVTLQTGDEITIRWRAENLPIEANNRLNLNLVKIENGKEVKGIGMFSSTATSDGSLANDGSEGWTVPYTLESGTYKVRIGINCPVPFTNNNCFAYADSGGKISIVFSQIGMEAPAAEERILVSSRDTRPYIEGIILVNTRSTYVDFAEKLANERGWYLLKVTSSNPKSIRQSILTVTDANRVTYLLILGDEDQIPIIDYEALEQLVFNQGMMAEHLFGIRDPNYGTPSALVANNILDSLYYSNVDDDPFVELAVGRLPFNDRESIESYFSNLDRSKEINNVGIVRVIDETAPGPIDTVTIKKHFVNISIDNFITTRISSSRVSDYLRNSDLFSIHTHGSPTTFVLPGNPYTLDDIPDLSVRKPIFISGACNAAQEFGKEFIRKKGTAFIGYYIVAQPNTNVFPIRPLHIDDSIGQSIKDVINKDIAIKKGVPLAWFPSTYYLIGDPSIRIKYTKLSVVPELDFEQTQEGLVVTIPPYQKEITRERSSDEVVLFIDGVGRSRGWNMPIFHSDIYNTVVDQGYFTVSDPDFLRYWNEAAFFVECDPNRAAQYGGYQCLDMENDTEYAVVSTLQRFGIDVPYRYASWMSDSMLSAFVFNVESDATHKISTTDSYIKVGEHRFPLHDYFTYEIVSGDRENFLLLRLSTGAFFDLVRNGDLFKEKKIILVFEK